MATDLGGKASQPHLPLGRRHPHLRIERAPDVEPERVRRGAGPPLRPSRNRKSHAEAIGNAITQTLTDVADARGRLRIAPDTFIVAEFRSFDRYCREVLEERFGATVVSEHLMNSEGDGELFRVLAQFPSKEEIGRLRDELDRFGDEDRGTGALPPGLRRDFFDCLEAVTAVSRQDRVGKRLGQDGFPEEQIFPLDVDLWISDPDSSELEVRRSLQELCRTMDCTLDDDLTTSGLLLARVSASRELAEALLDLDLVAMVNLPPRLPAAYEVLFEPVDPLPAHVQPTGDEPIVTVLDSGVMAGHPLLRGWILDERDFATGEGTAADRQGHGTGVAGLAMYGDVAHCLQTRTWKPGVLIANAKILVADPVFQHSTRFPVTCRPERVVAEAIRYFHRARGCRVFNLSVGDPANWYTGGRQFPWAEVLDRLSRELDVVIVVSAGNCDVPVPESAANRVHIQEQVRDALLDRSENRVCSPATAAIAVTVGAVSRSDSPYAPARYPGSPKGGPSPFSRVGPGYQVKPKQQAIKPEFVAFGGNRAISNPTGSNPRWMDVDPHLGEPTTRLETGDGRFVTTLSGTSMAAPQVSHSAALALESASRVLGPANANAARALLGVCAELPPCGSDWLRDPKQKEMRDKLRLVGYGMVNRDLVEASLRNDAVLVASDRVGEDRWHIYELRVPPAFLDGRGPRSLSVALAFDPPVRAARREYLARTMWIEVLKGLTLPEVERYRSYVPRVRPPQLPQSKVLGMRPPKSTVQWSTLQVRRAVWKRGPRFPRAGSGQNSTLHIIVGCHRRFPHGEDPMQRYSLAVRLWHSRPGANLYAQLKTTVRVQTHPARIGRRT